MYKMYNIKYREHNQINCLQEATNPPALHLKHRAPTILYGKKRSTCMISYFYHEVDEICTLLGNYAVYSGNSLLMFRHNLLVPSRRVK